MSRDGEAGRANGGVGELQRVAAAGGEPIVRGLEAGMQLAGARSRIMGGCVERSGLGGISSHVGVRIAIVRSVSVILCLAAFVYLTGCRSRGGQAREPRNAPNVVTVESRVDVVLGRTLVMPVTLKGAVNPAKPIAAKLDDGRKMKASLYWVNAAPGSNEATLWVPEPGKWTATPASSGTRPAGSGAWVVVVDLPTDAIGQGLWLGNGRVALNWLPSPDLIRGPHGVVTWSSPLDELAKAPSLLRLAEAERKSPVRRWRHRLMSSGLLPRMNPILNPGADNTPEPDAFMDPVLEALAQQMEGRWQVALATLWLADPGVAEQVKRRLTGVVDFGDGNIVPAWPVDQADLDTLRGDLLNARLQPAQQVERAVAWLEGLPPGAAWVVDDAGQCDAMSGQTVATCGVANLSERDTLGWTTVGEIRGSPELARVAGWTAVNVAGSLVPTDEEQMNRGDGGLTLRGPVATPLEIHLGRWSSVRQATLEKLLARPPGVRLEPLIREWDLTTWLAGGIPTPMDEAWSAAGLVYLDATQKNAVGGGWMLYLEFKSPVIGREESARVWLGAFGAPSSVLKIVSTGQVVDEAAPKFNLDVGVSGASVSRQGDVWTARVPIPSRCVESDGTLRIGIERMDGLGRRTSWPRAMMPWQTEPGRVALDTRAWDGGERAGK